MRKYYINGKEVNSLEIRDEWVHITIVEDGTLDFDNFTADDLINALKKDYSAESILNKMFVCSAMQSAYTFSAYVKKK